MILKFPLICTTIVLSYFLNPSQLFGQTYINDSLMEIHVNSGYAEKHFVSNGKKKNGKKTGMWQDYHFREIEYYKFLNGQTRYKLEGLLTYGEGKYVKDKRQGLWKIYLIDNDTKAKIHGADIQYDYGLWNGKTTYFYPDGNVAATANMKDNLLEGVFEIYSPSGTVINRINYVGGKANGLLTLFYSSGELKSEVNYCSNKKCGKMTRYFKDGQIESEQHYTNDTLNGTCSFWYQNGKLKETCHYTKGLLDGTYRYYYDNGQLWVERVSKAGLLVSINFLFDKLGNPMDYGDFSNGNGKLKYYTETGEIYLIETYKNGEVVDKIHYEN